MIDDVKPYIGVFMSVASRIVDSAVQDRQKELKDKHGISSVHIKYLMILRSGPLTLSQLSQYLFLDKANTTRAIATLKELGYVEDDRVKESQRGYKVFLTSSGKALSEELNRSSEEFMDNIMTDVSDEELMAFFNVMEKICARMDDCGDRYRILEGVLNNISMSQSGTMSVRDDIADRRLGTLRKMLKQ